jgi:hypothetical protein
MFDYMMSEAVLTDYTQEEIAKAEELHEAECAKNCSAGPFKGIDPNGWLDYARVVVEREHKATSDDITYMGATMEAGVDF